jgi:hypothetical protein
MDDAEHRRGGYVVTSPYREPSAPAYDTNCVHTHDVECPLAQVLARGEWNHTSVAMQRQAIALTKTCSGCPWPDRILGPFLQQTKRIK